MHQKKIRILMLIFLFTMAVKASMTPSVMTSWSANLTRLTTFPYFDGHPSITQTNDGKIWIIWAQETFENLTLTYTTSSDLGATWSDEMNLTEILTEGQNSCPSIIQTIDGTIWVVWHSNRPPPPRPPGPDFSINASPTSLTIPQGGTDTSNITVTSLDNFSEPVDLAVFFEPPGVTTTLDPTQVTPPPNGSANSTFMVEVGAAAMPKNYTLTVIGTNEELGLSHTVDIDLQIVESTIAEAYGGTFSSKSSSGTEETNSGTIYDHEIYYKTSSDYGATWSNDTQLTTNLIEDINPSVIQLINGTILVVWQSDRTENHDIFYKTSSDGGVSWSNAAQLTTDSNLDRGPSVTQMKDGRIWVAWHSNRFGDNEVFYKIYDGLSWSDDLRLTSSTDEDSSPSIVQTLDGTIWIFWSLCVPLGTPDLYYKTSLDNGVTWSERVQFTTDPYNDTWPCVIQTNDTKIWVVWVSSRADQPYGNWDIWYKTSLAGDLNDDGIVDINDLARVSDAYGFTLGDPDWDAAADINEDDIIDVYDLAIIGKNYGAT